MLAGSGTRASRVEGEAEIKRTKEEEERKLEIAGTEGVRGR